MKSIGEYGRPFVPWFGWIGSVVLTGISIVVIGVTMTAQREISNPFSEFSDLFGDNARQWGLEHGFTCQDSGGYSLIHSGSGYCAQRDLNGMFSGIYMRMSGGTANEIIFSLHENTLTLGDLVLIWGQAEIQWYCETAVAAWPSRHITGLLATPQTRRVNYFVPVLSVSFTRSGSSHWGRILLNDRLHDCGKR